MENIVSHSEFVSKAEKEGKAFLLLYKSGNEPSQCAFDAMAEAFAGAKDTAVFAADVATVRDIHPVYGITTVPSLLIFENGNLTSVIKGCQGSDFYKAMAENAIYRAKAQAEGKTVKSVTVYSTPTCSWCNTLKTWLRKNSIPFTDVDISRNQSAAEELVRRSGQQGVPQTDINGEIVVGFDQKKLKELLEVQ
jgi:glutaredoxin-like YruB-family protein